MKKPTRVKFNIEKAKKEFSNPSKQFKPKEGERYWYIETGWKQLEVKSEIFWKTNGDKERLKQYNYFRTKKEAMNKLKEIKAILKK